MSRCASNVAGLGLMLITGLLTTHASAYCRTTTESGPQVGETPCNDGSGEPLVWANPCLSFAIDERGSNSMELSEIESAVDSAFDTWESTLCDGQPVNLVFHRLPSSTCQRGEFNESGNVNTIAFLEPWEEKCEPETDRRSYPGGVFALTTVWHNGTTGEIFDADILINDERANQFILAGGPYTNCPPDGCLEGLPGSADLETLVAHEVGHFIGIGHSDIAASVMFPQFLDRTHVRRDLHPDDQAAVCAAYPPGSLTETCEPSVIGGLKLSCEDDGLPLCNEEPMSPPPDTPEASGGGCSASDLGADGTPWGTALMGLLVLALGRRRGSTAAAR